MHYCCYLCSYMSVFIHRINPQMEFTIKSFPICLLLHVQSIISISSKTTKMFHKRCNCFICSIPYYYYHYFVYTLSCSKATKMYEYWKSWFLQNTRVTNLCTNMYEGFDQKEMIVKLQKYLHWLLLSRSFFFLFYNCMFRANSK